MLIDAEFARRLQAIDEEGRDTDRIQDAERWVLRALLRRVSVQFISLLGREAIDEIMVGNICVLVEQCPTASRHLISTRRGRERQGSRLMRRNPSSNLKFMLSILAKVRESAV